MEDESASMPAKEKPANIEQYNQTITDETDKGYSGKLENSYGYEATQQAKPYSQTYSNTQKQASVQQTETKTITVPTPAAKQPSAATVKPTPSHNIQKNLTPTGMN